MRHLRWMFMVMLAGVFCFSSAAAEWAGVPPSDPGGNAIPIRCFLGAFVTLDAALFFYKAASVNDYNARTSQPDHRARIARFSSRADFQRKIGDLCGLFSASLLVGGIVTLKMNRNSIRIEKRF